MNNTMMNDGDSVLRGQLQELGVAVFAFLAQLGFLNGWDAGALVAAFVAVVLVGHAFYIKSSWRKVTTVVRKAIGALGAVAVAAGWVAAGQVDSLNGLLVVGLPMVWSWVEKVVLPEGVVGLLVVGFAGLCCFGSVSCGAVDVMVDRSMLKGSTATHDVYPSKAVVPVVNEEELQALFRAGVDEVNGGLSVVVNRVVEVVK